MNAKELLHAIGGISEKHIEGAAPERISSTGQRALPPRKRFLRYGAVAACALVFLFATTAFAASYIQNSLSVFYIRYLSPEEMAVADSMAEQYGAKVYFDGLKSGDVNKQYFSINKLVEYYNDEQVREEAIRAITPFLSSEAPAGEDTGPHSKTLADAAAFALSVLKKEFHDPRIFHMADGTILFTLFNDYSDYGTYNKLWQIKDDKLSEYTHFDKPLMYIRRIIQSPDKKLLAVSFVSNKSSYLVILDIENHVTSPELVDSARIMVAKDLDIPCWQRADFENYSSVEEEAAKWTDNNSITFPVSLWYPKADGESDTVINNVIVRYDFHQKHMAYEMIADESN